MQDLEIEGRCVLSSTFMMLCRVCMAIVLLVAIGFALDEVDIEHTTRALVRFLKNFSQVSLYHHQQTSMVFTAFV